MKFDKQSTSHPSHTSHSGLNVVENSSKCQYSEDHQKDYELIKDMQPTRIQLKHSPNADICTNDSDQKIGEDIEHSSSDNDPFFSPSSS